MAVRVRKLVKESRRSALEVIGVLHALGFDRYRSLDDMLPDPVVLRVEHAWKQGVRPLALPPDLVVALQRSVSGNLQTEGQGPGLGGARGPSVMGKLVPGVSALDSRPTASLRQVAATLPLSGESARPVVGGPVSAAQSATPSAGIQVVESALAQLVAARLQLEASRAQLEEAQTKLEREREALATERETLAGERRLLAEERAAVVVERATLEAERAIMAVERAARSDARAALAVRGSLGELRNSEPREGASGALSTPGGTVNGAPASPVGEASSARPVELLFAKIGEGLLLNGLRRLVVVGGSPGGQEFLREHLDPRVDIRFLPGSTRGRHDAESDVMRTDIVVLWGCDPDSDALDVYRTARAMLVHTPDGDTLALGTALEAALRA